MADALLYVTYIGLILLVGLLSSIISRKLKIPNLLLLILIGMGAGYIKYNGRQVVAFSPLFLTTIAIITLALVVFDSSSKFKFKKFDSVSLSAMKLAVIFLILNTVLLSAATYYLFSSISLILAVIFAIVVSGTDPSSTMMVLSGAKSKLFELIKVEAILNTPLIVLIPFLLIDVIKGATNVRWTSQIIPFAQQFVVGIGTGILIGLIFFRFMKKYYSATLSPLATITAALLTYQLAEILGGNGVLAVTTAGLMFGNLYKVKHKQQIQQIGEVLSEVLQILVFVLIGTVLKLPWNAKFLIPASLLFVIYLGIRFIAVNISFLGEFNFKEKLYMSLNIPKGVAVAVVVFTLATQAISGMTTVLHLILYFLIVSIVLSTIITHFSKFFTNVDIKISETE